MHLTDDLIRSRWAEDRSKQRRRFAAGFIIFIAALVFCLCFRYNAYYYDSKFALPSNLKSYALAVRLLCSRITGGRLFVHRDEVIESFGTVAYYGALARLRITAVAFVSGAGLAVSGAIFQSVYRNPMASPNIIGATAGVDLGNVLVVTMFSARAYQNILLRYQYCYGLTAICVGLVLILGRVASIRRKNISLMEIVMAGSIISQAFRVFAMYFMYELPEEDLLLYEEISLGTYPDTSMTSMLIFFGVMALSLFPVLLMRYRMNCLTLTNAESATIGLSSGKFRVIAQVCGVLMVTCSMIHCGEIGMISLVIPYILRQKGFSDFRYLCVLSAIIGGSIVMVCNLAASLIYIAGTPLPTTFIIELVLIPAFMIILSKARGNQHEF